MITRTNMVVGGRGQAAWRVRACHADAELQDHAVARSPLLVRLILRRVL
jgi:hypothetical protein